MTAAADAVIEFYEQNLLLARTVRDADIRHDLAEIIDNVAQLVDQPLKNVDQWIKEVVGYTGMLATFDASPLTSEQMTYQLPLEIWFDDDRLDRIR